MRSAAPRGAGVPTGVTPQITNPDWLKKPSAGDMANLCPAGAGPGGGKAAISCIVTSRGTLDSCAVVSEAPAGHGFGAAALALASLFMMRPKTENGEPIGAAAGMVNTTNQVVANLPWSQTPTAADMVAAVPPKSVGHVARAHVVLRCRPNRQGGVDGCQTVTEEPIGLGFGRAARGLIKDFQILDEPAVKKDIKDVFVDIPFDFRGPSKPSLPPELIDPQWICGPDPQMAGNLFPPKAVKAGFKTGLGVLDCDVARDGSLTGCSVVREDPEGNGLRQAGPGHRQHHGDELLVQAGHTGRRRAGALADPAEPQPRRGACEIAPLSLAPTAGSARRPSGACGCGGRRPPSAPA